MRTERGWSDVTIANVSPRGLMLQGAERLQRNDFIEVRYQQVCIVGRIVWVGGARCGVRTQDRVDVSALLSGLPPKRRGAGEERRASIRKTEPRPRRAAAEIAARSRRTGHLLDWVIVAAAGSAAAAFAAQAAYAALDTPLAKVGAVLTR